MASLYATTVCLLRLNKAETRRDEPHLHPITERPSGPYLAPTNSSQGGSLLHRWTVSNGPKLSVRYSTLSEQLWSKSTLGATLVDLQDMVAARAASQCHSASTVNAIFGITIRWDSCSFKYWLSVTVSYYYYLHPRSMSTNTHDARL